MSTKKASNSMSKLQPWLNFAKVYRDAEGRWVLNVLGRKLFIGAYGGTGEGDTDECIIVIGNKRVIDDYDEGTIEAEFVFPQGEKLLTANVLKSDPTEPIDVDFKDLRTVVKRSKEQS